MVRPGQPGTAHSDQTFIQQQHVTSVSLRRRYCLTRTATERLWQKLTALLAVGVTVSAYAAETTVRESRWEPLVQRVTGAPVYLPACSKYGVMCDDAGISGRTALANLTRYKYLRISKMARRACKFVCLAVAELLSPSWPLSRHELCTQAHLLVCVRLCTFWNVAPSSKHTYTHTHTHTHTHMHASH